MPLVFVVIAESENRRSKGETAAYSLIGVLRAEFGDKRTSPPPTGESGIYYTDTVSSEIQSTNRCVSPDSIDHSEARASCDSTGLITSFGFPR